MSYFQKNKTTLILLIALIAVGGGILTYFSLSGSLARIGGPFREEEEIDPVLLLLFLPQSATFSPTIDGTFGESEWSGADWIFTEYLITDAESLDAYNYFYIHAGTEYLYICADLVSDITNGTDEEWFSCWIDTNSSGDAFYADEVWNASINLGQEMFCYNTSTEEFMDYCYDEANSLYYLASLNETAVDLAFGFQTTRKGGIAHRVYEARIDKDALEGFGESFGISFLGYGTMFTIVSTSYWGSPTYFNAEFYYHTLIDELAMFHCYADGYDLDSLPEVTP